MNPERTQQSIINNENAWDNMTQEASRRKAEIEKGFLEDLRIEAEKVSKEPFDVDKVMKIYYPNGLTDNEDRMRNDIEGLETSYYLSRFATLKEWAGDLNRIEAQGDS